MARRERNGPSPERYPPTMEPAVSTAWNAARHAGWAPAARELAALGFRAVALDGDAVHADAAEAGRALRGARGAVVAVFAPRGVRDPAGGVATAGLAAVRPEHREIAMETALAAAAAASAAGTPRVVLRVGEIPTLDPRREDRWTERLGREGASSALLAEVAAAADELRTDRVRALDALCRSVHALCRARPETSWLVETPVGVAGLPLPGEALHLFDDLRGRRVGYWHDTAHAARLGALGLVPPGEWLARLGPAAGGVTLSDWSPAGGRTPPGAGLVDWPGLRDQLGAGAVRVLRLDPVFPAPILVEAARQAVALGCS